MVEKQDQRTERCGVERFRGITELKTVESQWKVVV